MAVQTIHAAAERAVHALTPQATMATKKAAVPQSNITSTDFLSLLVSELKNQDPTKPTDPNEYVQQLVGVNSLQQLIQINQGLSSLESGSSSTEVSLPARY